MGDGMYRLRVSAMTSPRRITGKNAALLCLLHAAHPGAAFSSFAMHALLIARYYETHVEQDPRDLCQNDDGGVRDRDCVHKAVNAVSANSSHIHAIAIQSILAAELRSVPSGDVASL